MAVLGVDVSNHQGPINWAVVALTRKFAFMKASEDTDFYDAFFARNWRDAKTYSLRRGAYHFARPSKSSPAQSVTLFADALKRVANMQHGKLVYGDMLVLDIEDDAVPPNENLLLWVTEWLALCEKVLHRRPIIYSGMYYMRPHGLIHPEIAKYPLWLADYIMSSSSIPPQHIDLEYLFWQYTDKGRVPGIGHSLEDMFLGNLADLAALGKRV